MGGFYRQDHMSIAWQPGSIWRSNRQLDTWKILVGTGYRWRPKTRDRRWSERIRLHLDLAINSGRLTPILSSFAYIDLGLGKEHPRPRKILLRFLPRYSGHL